jgi:transcriptional regulator with XRE-family HTH domain
MNGAKIRSLRLSVHLSQRRLAFLVGVTAPAVSQREKGLTQPTEEHVRCILRALQEHGKTLERLSQALNPDETDFENRKPAAPRRRAGLREHQGS